MQLQGRNLKLNLRGADVRLLQFELGLLDLDIPHEEVFKNHFGDDTLEAVCQFQAKLHLDPTGIVEGTLAKYINAEVSERVPVEEALGRLMAVCQLTYEKIEALKFDMPNLRVDIQRLEDGLHAFALALKDLREPDAPDDFVAHIEELLNSGHAQLKKLVTSLNGAGSDDAMLFVVRGRIISHELRGLSGLGVVAMDKNIGQDGQLGKGRSGERGSYEIRYSLAGLQKQKPDVEVQVFDQDRNKVAVSAVRYNAEPDESGLDVVIPADKLPRPAEYRRLIGELDTHLGNLGERLLKKRLATLTEDEQQQDITYLANKTGWDARMVAMTSLASKFAEGSGIEPEFYYALFRAGVPADKTVLSQMAPGTVRQTWERAVEQKILPTKLKEKIPEALEEFKDHCATCLLKEPPQIGLSSLKKLIEGSGILDDSAQQRFAQLYYDQKDDLETFWESVRTEFPNEADRLQLDSRLAVLTTNNAPLIQRLHEQNGNLQAPLDLVRQGLYQSEAWKSVLGDDLSDLSIPDEIPGESPAEKKSNYATLMASQLRLSYPTAVVAEMVHSNAIDLRVEKSVKNNVTQFLRDQQGNFELGIHPVEQYNAALKPPASLEAPALAQLKRLQRVYQISPSDEAMGKLLEHGLDSAVAVTRYDEQTFVRSFKDQLGGEAIARLTYAKAHQVHHSVLNIATSYLLEKSAPPLVAFDNSPTLKNPEESGVLATLDRLFGEMDYCACEHCRSWLSPAAYLVDLLHFLDRDPNDWSVFIALWKADHSNAPYPFLNQEQWKRFQQDWTLRHPTQPLPNTEIIPIDALLGRRPDIQHVQLTCENTNTVLPYIDLVNEVLEYYVVNRSLDSFTGYNIEEGTSTEELLANPQFVNDAAYTQLRNQLFPLPFHQPLSALRRYFDHFDVPLHEAMERLRVHDKPERAGDVTEPAYGWQDILMERLQLSRPEYAILTDSSKPLQGLYGKEPAALTESELIDELSNAKTFARLLNLSYEELIDITRTQFINPHSHLIPKLEKLGVHFATIQDVLNGTDEAEFRALVPIDDLDMTKYGSRAKQSPDEKFRQLEQWLQDNEAQIMGLIVLSDPTGSEEICSFDTVELRYARPDFDNNKLRRFEFLKLLRFIRLQRKLGWSIEQTDKAIAALYPVDQRLDPDKDTDTANNKLDAGFKILIPRLAHLQTLMAQLALTPKRDLIALLACWSPIDTHNMYGSRSLYRQMFLNRSILALDNVFQEDGYGNYLQDPTQRVVAHSEALRAALKLTQEEFDLILQELNFDGDTVLNLANVSAIFRHGYLARKLRLSVSEFLALRAMSDLDPFSPLDMSQPPDPTQPFGAVHPPAIRFIELAQRIKQSPFEITQLLYFLQHVDLSGNASPSNQEILAFAQSIRNDLLRIDSEHAVQDDASGEIAKSKMALVYGNEATDIFFGLLNNTSLFTVDYNHGQPALEGDILTLTNRIAYDDFQKQLSFQGVMTAAEKSALDGAASATDPFRTAVQALFNDGQNTFAAFFDRYPLLTGLYQNFADSNASLEDKMSALLADFLPDFKHQLKRQQVRQTVSPQVDAELALVTLLLENAELLHAVGVPADSAIMDFLALETQGMSADIFFADDVTGAADQANILVHTIDYREGGTTLPRHPAGGKISGVWRGALEVPDNGFYNFYIQADANAEISLELDGKAVTLVLSNGVWQNQDAIELQAGRLYDLAFTVKKVKDLLVLKWERKGMGRVPIPAAQLYPAAPLARFRSSYLRLLKALAIADTLSLSSAEMKHFATHVDYSLNGKADIFFADDVVGVAGRADIVNTIDYPTGGVTLPSNLGGGNATVSGVWHGFLEAPDNGFYNFYMEADPSANITLTLDGEPVTLVLKNSIWQNQDPIELEIGRLYDLTFSAKKVKDLLVLKWKRNLTTISEGTVLPIGMAGWLNALPTKPSSARATHALLRNISGLLQYRALKEAFNIRDESLLQLLQEPSAVGEDGVLLLNRVTGWQEADRTALLNHFGLATGELAHLEHFSRLHEAFVVLKKLGIGATTLIKNTTNQPTADMRRELQARLRARYDQSAWLQVIQLINDDLRTLQRDALVAYVLHQLAQDPATAHINTPDKLFEYFLIDVQMDSCMKTSRIKQAISSVQLFVQRSLMNLEPQVASSSINARQWAWMKRYRVWEANRKVFLWPENWLEPELRDNKSPFFKEFESELLQSDITDDAAATALVHYLEKLDQVAKLEICGMYYEENKFNDEADDIVHVIARTAGAQRTYYYRRQEGGTSWTPWEKIDLNIEDNPVLPVVWKGRLFLFWVSILHEVQSETSNAKRLNAMMFKRSGSQPIRVPDKIPDETCSESGASASNAPKKTVTNMTPSELKGMVGEAKIRLGVVLYWSEYYHGKWQPARTSDVHKPLVIGDFQTDEFDRAKVKLSSKGTSSSQLTISVAYDDKIGNYFKLYNTHSLPIPVRQKDDNLISSSWSGLKDYFEKLSEPFLIRKRIRSFPKIATILSIEYSDPRAQKTERSFDRNVLTKALPYEIIDPRHQVAGIFEAPFFFQDGRHVFYVTSKESRVLVSEVLDVGLRWLEPVIAVSSPVVVRPDVPSSPEGTSGPPAHLLLDPEVLASTPVASLLRENRYIHKVMNMTGTLRFGDRVIGPGGSMGFENMLK